MKRISKLISWQSPSTTFTVRQLFTLNTCCHKWDKKRRLNHQHCSSPQLYLISAMADSFTLKKQNLLIIWQWWQWSLCVASAKQKNTEKSSAELTSGIIWSQSPTQLTLVELHLQLRGNKKWELELLLLLQSRPVSSVVPAYRLHTVRHGYSWDPSPT